MKDYIDKKSAELLIWQIVEKLCNIVEYEHIDNIIIQIIECPQEECRSNVVIDTRYLVSYLTINIFEQTRNDIIKALCHELAHIFNAAYRVFYYNMLSDYGDEDSSLYKSFVFAEEMSAIKLSKIFEEYIYNLTPNDILQGVNE